MEQIELQRAIEAILFAAGERVDISRLAMTLEADPDEIAAAADALADELAFNRRGIRILRLEDERVLSIIPPPFQYQSSCRQFRERQGF